MITKELPWLRTIHFWVDRIIRVGLLLESTKSRHYFVLPRQQVAGSKFPFASDLSD